MTLGTWQRLGAALLLAGTLFLTGCGGGGTDELVVGEYGSLTGEKDAIDVDEIITALAKTVAELTYGSDAALRQRVLEDLMREISQFEAEFANAPASDMRH